MKKLNYLLLSALMTLCLVSFTACSDDDDDGNDNGLLIGTWNKSSSKIDVDVQPATIKAVIQEYLNGESNTPSSNIYSKITFMESGTCRMEVLLGTSQGTYVFKNNKLTIISADEGLVVSDVYKTTINTLEFRYDKTEAIKALLNNNRIWEEIGTTKPDDFQLVKAKETTTFSLSR